MYCTRTTVRKYVNKTFVRFLWQRSLPLLDLRPPSAIRAIAPIRLACSPIRVCHDLFCFLPLRSAKKAETSLARCNGQLALCGE